jgi:hypothetical protein
MRKTIYCNGVGAVYSNGIYSLLSEKHWDNTQIDPESVRRDQVIDSLMPTFGKLNLPDKLAFCASALALSGNPDCGGDRSGICIAVPYGSLTTDMFFMESVLGGLPGPAYFSATLPSSTIADIAIHNKFKGPNRVFSGGDTPVFDSLMASFNLINSDKADTVLFLSAWAIDLCNRPRLSNTKLAPNSAFCVLFSTRPSSESSRKCSLIVKKHSSLRNSSAEYDFCIHLTNALRKLGKNVIPFSSDTPENYFEIT